MRVLFVVHNVYTEYTNGAARSMRTMLGWLAAAGHASQVLSAATFESTPGATLLPHLASIGVAVETTAGTPCPVHHYRLDGVTVQVLENRHHAPKADRAEGQQFLDLFDALVARFRPDAVVTYGGHPALQMALANAQAAGVTTIRTLRALGYDEPGWFTHVDRVLCTSAYLTAHYRARTGLHSTPLPSPIMWSEVQGDADARGFLTFVNPSPHKGLALFARLADMLGGMRPDIPILIVQSAGGATTLDAIRGLDLARYPQIMVSPPIADTRALFALTKILLVPSIFDEPFGRVAAEAMINGVPAVVSDRGALPETVAEGGVVVPLPSWMEPAGRAVPNAEEVRPWFDAVTRLWDDEAEYNRVAEAARAAADRLYGEAALRARYEAYFSMPGPYEALFSPAGPIAP